MNDHAVPVEVDQKKTHDPKSAGVYANAKQNTVIAMFLSSVIAVSWFGPFDLVSASYIEDAIKQALAAYTVARGLNALVSFLQTISVVGLGIGQFLEPINNLVERFSSVMEIAIASLYLQKILISITTSLICKFALLISGGLLILSLYVRTGLNSILISRVFISLVFIRFSIPIVVIFNGMVSAAFISDTLAAEVAAIKTVEEKTDVPEFRADQKNADAQPPAVTLPDGVPNPDGAVLPPAQAASAPTAGFFDKIFRKMKNAPQVMKDKLPNWGPKALKENLDKVVPKILNAMALFLLQSLFLPILFLYGTKYALTAFWDLKPISLYTGKTRRV